MAPPYIACHLFYTIPVHLCNKKESSPAAPFYDMYNVPRLWDRNQDCTHIIASTRGCFAPWFLVQIVESLSVVFPHHAKHFYATLLYLFVSYATFFLNGT